MDELLNLLITTGVGLILLGASYLADLLSGIIKVIFTPAMKWNWKKFFEDLIKALLIAFSTEYLVATFYILNWFASSMGVNVEQLSEGLTTVSMALGCIGGSYYFLLSASKNLLNFLNTKHTQIEYDPDKLDIDKIAKDVKDIAGTFVKHDASTKVDINAEKGASCYYKVDVSTPTAFYNAVNGKGFNEGWGYQCVAGFKEFMYSLSGSYANAGGCAKNYAYSHDAVEALGFKWHGGTKGLQNGDWCIWTSGEFGHVAMYYNGKFFGQNQGASNGAIGTPFNLMSLSLNGMAGYYRPDLYAKPQPTPAPNPPKKKVSYTYKKGDTFGQVILDLGLNTSHGLWGADGDVAYYTEQLHAQGLHGNIPIGTTIYLTPRKD